MKTLTQAAKPTEREQSILDAIRAVMTKSKTYRTADVAQRLGVTANIVHQNICRMRAKRIQLPAESIDPRERQPRFTGTPTELTSKEKMVLDAVKQVVARTGHWTFTELMEITKLSHNGVSQTIRRIYRKGVPFPYKLSRSHRGRSKNSKLGATSASPVVIPERNEDAWRRWAWRILIATRSHWEDAIFMRSPPPGGRKAATWRQEIIDLTGKDPGEPRAREEKPRTHLDRLRRAWRHPDPWIRIALAFGASGPVREKIKANQQARRAAAAQAKIEPYPFMREAQ